MSSSSQILPGFSAEQTASLTQLIQHTLREALEPYFGPLPQCKQPVSMPKPTTQELEQEKKPLPQAIAEDNMKSTAESISGIASSRPDTTSLLSTIVSQSAIQICRESAPYLSTARISIAIQHAPLAPQLASLLGYIRDAEDMKATGQG